MTQCEMIMIIRITRNMIKLVKQKQIIPNDYN